MEAPQPQPVKAVLALRRISQTGLADELGVSRVYIGRVVNGWYRPSTRIAHQLADLLETPVEELFRPEDLEPVDPYSGEAEFTRSTNRGAEG